MLAVIVASACLIWYIAVVIVCTVGYVQLYRYYRSRPRRAESESLPHHEIPHVTVIRPVKGLEPNLYECLAATFHQTYPKDKLTIFFCVSTRSDPSLPILHRLLDDFPGFDATILVEDEDPVLQSDSGSAMGPNPKIRNMSRAYREAKGDIVWIIDCNVWVGKGVAGRMIDTLCGYGRQGSQTKYKFVHQLPVVVDVTERAFSRQRGEPLLGNDDTNQRFQAASTSTSVYSTLRQEDLLYNESLPSRALKLGGGRLEELFLASSHAKFYTAINTVLIAPCIVGKSNMFRHSHLDTLTAPSSGAESRPSGIDYFSHNICEDHLIGDLLWKRDVPEEQGDSGTKFGKHALVFGDLAIQPMAGMSVGEYFARRMRWLRVRKFTVPLATLVEPGTECFLCSAYGAFAVTTLPWFSEHLSIPQTWTAAVVLWILSVAIWAGVDWTLYLILHSMASVEMDENTPAFVKATKDGHGRSFFEWLAAWVGRETLALPIWSWAIYGGVTVTWRGRKFRVGWDATVQALDSGSASFTENGGVKTRRD